MMLSLSKTSTDFVYLLAFRHKQLNLKHIFWNWLVLSGHLYSKKHEPTSDFPLSDLIVLEHAYVE
jgi:hypothetical protein